MNLNQPTLIQFENERNQNNFIPPAGSNSFYTIGNGRINLKSIKDDKDDYRFDLFTDRGHVYVGPGSFEISGDNHDVKYPYRNLIVIQNTKLSVNTALVFVGCEVEIYGTLELMESSRLYIRDGAHVIFYVDSTFIVKNNSNIIIDDKSSIEIYGKINTHLSKVDNLVKLPNIIIDSAAVMTVDGINTTGRVFSMTDYEIELRDKVINVNTQGEKNFTDGRVGYKWTDGKPLECSQVIQMGLLWGQSILGDFKLSILGMPKRLIPNLQTISDIIIKEDTTLYISENYKESKFIRPELYIGIIINNTIKPGACIVEGTIIVDGENAMITVDRGASLHIQQGGCIQLKNDAIIRSTHNEPNDRVFMIEGTLIIDDIEQIGSFTHDNILIGETGKVIILNPDRGEKRLLWSTPNGIKDSELYRLFEDRIDHVEYHISNNTGIAVDEYFEFYSRQMTNWYGNRRIEKAIHDKILVWHDGGFIQLDHDIIPWADIDSTLLQVGRLFKTFGSFDEDKLQDAVDRLKYAGAGNIIFRFVNKDKVKEILMDLSSVDILSILNNASTNMYTVNTDAEGELFLRNKISDTSSKNIINEDSRSYDIIDNKVEFQLK